MIFQLYLILQFAISVETDILPCCFHYINIGFCNLQLCYILYDFACKHHARNAGAKHILPGICLPFSSGVSFGISGVSLEYTTFNDFTPLSLSSFRITFARGQTLVLYMSQTSKFVPSLLPVPMHEMIGTPAFLHEQ